MWIIKRDGSRQAYAPEKISRAIARSFDSAGTPIDPAALAGLVTLVEEKIRRMHKHRSGWRPSKIWWSKP